ncbi:MAG TPA: hypothetical protein VGM05_00770 [Planctomycetaceae bacterium]|jgi:hypothetical protein
MTGSRISQGMISGLLLSAALLADEPNTPPVAPGASKPAAAQPGASRTIRLHLMEGSIVTGRLSTEMVTVSTEFGRLDIPVANIVSFTPGLDSHPEERKRIGRLIQQLGSNAAAERDTAQRMLTEMGKTVQMELARYTQDEDTERRTRVQKILSELEDADDDDDTEHSSARPWLAQDSLETNLFTVVGKISPQSFDVQTQFGPLKVAISDIRRGEREVDQKPEIRKSIPVTGENLVQLNMQNSGIRLNHGDKVQVTADGRLTMTPWGNTTFSTPEGSEQFQWYAANQIPGGALVARVGTAGKIFKIGSKNTFTAPRAGVLYFGIAMSPQFATQDYNYPGRYDVKVRVNPK